MVADPGRRLNFRDLGGLPAGGGRRLRAGVLFRSEAPVRFTDSELARLAGLGIATVCDLRAPTERQDGTVVWPPAERRPELLEMAVWGDGGPRGVGLRKSSAESVEAFREMMLGAYRSMPGSLAEGALASLFATILAGQVPVMVHCSQGKDRTGVVVALVCAAAGVEREAIRTDYMLSNEHFDRVAAARQTARSLAGPGAQLTDLQPEVALALEAHVDYLDAAWEAAAAEYGSLEAYLEAAAGLDRGARARLRELMTEPAAPGPV